MDVGPKHETSEAFRSHADCVEPPKDARAGALGPAPGILIASLALVSLKKTTTMRVNAVAASRA
jgi:hypothetical protein